MIENKEMARTFFKCLQGMDIEYVCFDGDGKLLDLVSCDQCGNEGDCMNRMYWVEDLDSIDYFIEDYDLEE